MSWVLACACYFLFNVKEYKETAFNDDNNFSRNIWIYSLGMYCKIRLIKALTTKLNMVNLLLNKTLLPKRQIHNYLIIIQLFSMECHKIIVLLSNICNKTLCNTCTNYQTCKIQIKSKLQNVTWNTHFMISILYRKLIFVY